MGLIWPQIQHPETWGKIKFQQVDWNDFYHNAKEAIPPNAAMPHGHSVQINTFVDADDIQGIMLQDICIWGY